MDQTSNSKLTQPIEVPSYLKISKVIVYFIYAWVIFGVVVLGLRIFLLATSANPSSGFVEFIYNTSFDYLAPFRGIFPPKTVGQTGYLDVASIFAMIMYMLFGWGIASLIEYIQSKIDIIKGNERDRQAKLERLTPRPQPKPRS